MPNVDILIVGAGISGIGAGIECLRRGHQSFLVLEAAHDLGGTWRDNTYPGVAVDIPSVSYCFAFETDYAWSREFAPGAEIQKYVTHCADKYGVTAHTRFRSRVVRAQFDQATDTWATHLDDGTVVTSRYLIAATGLFTQPIRTASWGLCTVPRREMHTSAWDHDHDLTRARVAIIGTGASAVQIVPALAAQAAQLFVFQRTPIWISPRFDRPLHPGRRWSPRRFALVRKVLRATSEFSIACLTFSIANYRTFPFVVHALQRGLRAYMRRQVTDPATAAQLVPAYGLGCKRPTTSNDYLPAFNRDNVQLVTQPIARVCPEGIVTVDQGRFDVDTIVLATGFETTEPGTGPAFEVVGREGVELGRFWAANRRQAYAGVSVPGFPNFFLTAGPYAGGFNWFAMLEANLAHIFACIDQARARGATRVEVTTGAHDHYMQEMWRRADGTVFKAGSCATAHSYYLDRHGDASLPLPHTPWWLVWHRRWHGTRGYRFQRLGQAA